MSSSQYYRTTDNRLVLLDNDVYATWVQTGHPKADTHYLLIVEPEPAETATQVAESHIEINNTEKKAYKVWTLRNKTAEEMRKIWTAYEFLNRLTASERADIRQRALTDPNVADFLMLATAAQEILSDDPVTIIGMDYMVLIGVFTQSRRNEILEITNGS